MNQTFEIIFDNASLPKNAIESLASILSEALMKISNEGIQISAMDGSHICLIDLFIHKSDCIKFDANISGDCFDLGINFDDLSLIMDRVKANHYVKLSFDSLGKNVMVTAINEQWETVDLSESEKACLPKNSRKKTKDIRSMSNKSKDFTLEVIDIEVEQINTSSLREIKTSMDTKFGILNSELHDIILDSSIYSEVLEITGSDMLVFSADGTRGNYNNKYGITQIDHYECHKPSFGSFAIQFLRSIIKSEKLPIDSLYHILLKSESPLSLEVKISEKSYIQYFLAPRVEEESNSSYDEDAISNAKPAPIQKPECLSIKPINSIEFNALINKAFMIDDLDEKFEINQTKLAELQMRYNAIEKQDFKMIIEVAKAITDLQGIIAFEEQSKGELEKAFITA